MTTAPQTARTPSLEAYFTHPDARVETASGSATIGPGTRIWAFAHILAGARVGADCNICDHVFIEGGAVTGDPIMGRRDARR